MKASARQALHEAVAELYLDLEQMLGVLDKTPPASEFHLTAGADVQFKSRGRVLSGKIGQVSEDGEKLYVYVENEDGFGSTGFRVTRASVIEPEVESGLSAGAEAYLGRLLKVKKGA